MRRMSEYRNKGESVVTARSTDEDRELRGES